MFDKMKHKTKPIRISVSPRSDIAEIFEDDGYRNTIVGQPAAVLRDKGNSDPSREGMLATFRRKSKTEPAIVLSSYEKADKGKSKVTYDSKNTVASKQLQDRFSSGVVSSFGAFPGEVESVILAGTIGSIASFSGSRLFSKVVDDADKVDADIFNNFDFPITNLVFEGGGNKGMAYVGAIRVCNVRPCYITEKSILTQNR